MKNKFSSMEDTILSYNLFNLKEAFYSHLKRFYLSLAIILSFSIVFTQSGSITFGDVNELDQTIEIFYSSDEDIKGFQFELSGIDIDEVYGGDISTYNFMISSTQSRVLGFNLMGGHIPAGSGLLGFLKYNSIEDETCFSYAKLTTHSGESICGACSDINNQPSDCSDPNYEQNPCDTGECITQSVEVLGCTDEEALNYNPNATSDDGSCDYEISGCTDEDALNYNSNATSDDGSCVFDQAYQASITLGEFVEGQGSIDVLYLSNVSIAGFQFSVSGAELTNVESDLGYPNFNPETGVVAVFSLSGETLPPGEGVLATLYYNIGDDISLCINDILLGSPVSGVSIESNQTDCIIVSDGHVYLSIDNVNEVNGTFEINYESNTDIAGFQFNVSGVTIQQDGSFSDVEFFNLLPQTGNVVGFYASGGSLPSGQGQLATLSFDLGAERDLCINDVIIGGNTTGSNLDIYGPGCVTVPATPIDCNQDFNGLAEIDECGECCSGNTGIDCSYYNDRFDFGGAYDCAGLCNGDSELLDFCFDSDNDGLGAGQIDYNCSGLIESGWVVDCSDECPNDANNDIDDDGVCGDIDNCIDTENSDQSDNDGDGDGDACDCDDDNDGCIDLDCGGDDVNQFSFSIDTDGDGIHDDCDEDIDNDGIVNEFDSDPFDKFVCSTEEDTCDDCSSGTYDPCNDGPDNDEDCICDTGDLDDDNDGMFRY